MLISTSIKVTVCKVVLKSQVKHNIDTTNHLAIFEILHFQTGHHFLCPWSYFQIYHFQNSSCFEDSMCYLPSSHLPSRDILYTYLIACDHILKVLGVHLWFLSANALMSDEWWWGGFSTATYVFTIPSLSGSHDQVPNHLCFHYFTLVSLIGLCFIYGEKIHNWDAHFKVRNIIENPHNYHSPLMILKGPISEIYIFELLTVFCMLWPYQKHAWSCTVHLLLLPNCWSPLDIC